ncbi:hypothetical protein LQ327_02905 [Actinomycetospora endophytica]|uniref:Uncharacterized protein n=1 Tax=Actinomycetospora endophytica TaxID=2291215 RepID=A0ABS8P272_9PSEU|nr:hypothetical protein [Actinomycetospora endophytica]MCD2192346.1 hypothetical protein [Actinomycetospora endophytica]
MSPRPRRLPVPSALVGIVIALCAVLLLKWLAVVALVGWGVTVLARWLWTHRHQRVTVDVEPAPASGRSPEAVGTDCSWCGLAGGHRDLRGRPVRPRLAHAVVAGSAASR